MGRGQELRPPVDYDSPTGDPRAATVAVDAVVLRNPSDDVASMFMSWGALLGTALLGQDVH